MTTAAFNFFKWRRLFAAQQYLLPSVIMERQFIIFSLNNSKLNYLFGIVVFRPRLQAQYFEHTSKHT